MDSPWMSLLLTRPVVCSELVCDKAIQECIDFDFERVRRSAKHDVDNPDG